MTATLIEFVTSPGKHDLACDLLAREIKGACVQTNTLDVYTGVCVQEQRMVVVIALWPCLADAERFERDSWPKMLELLEPLLDTRPRFRLFDARTATAHKQPNPAVAAPVDTQAQLQVA